MDKIKILLITSNIYGKHLCTNKLQDISKTQDLSTQSFQGTRSEDRIVCKIGFVDYQPDYPPPACPPNCPSVHSHQQNNTLYTVKNTLTFAQSPYHIFLLKAVIHLPANLPARLPDQLLATHLVTCLPTCLLTYLPTCDPSLPAYLPGQ